MRRVDIITILGLAAGLFLVIGALFMSGEVRYFWSVASMVIVVGGSLSATLINFTLQDVKNIWNIVKQAFKSDMADSEELIVIFGDLARKARREGLLALEDDADRLDDAFFSKGIQMMVDAMEPEMIREILENDIENMVRRHEVGHGFFKTWGNLAPSFGLLGTLIGLIRMLAQLDSPETLGPSMALALVTTFYGVFLAYLILLPLSGKLKLRSEQETQLRQMMLEGIISIQSGVNPRILEERLRSFMAPKGRNRRDTEEMETRA